MKAIKKIKNARKYYKARQQYFAFIYTTKIDVGYVFVIWINFTCIIILNM